LYALATSNAFSRQAKDVMDQAKSRASELPDDLMGRLRETMQKADQTTATAKENGSPRRRRATTARKTGARRRTAAQSSR
jgi:hypothetical protein